ncbi:MAG: M23 family metallopeptidase [Patescibacteria group bacterium]
MLFIMNVGIVPSTRIGIGIVSLAILVWSAFFIVRFPETHPDATLRIAERIDSFSFRITFPLKLARLSMQEPDAALVMPVYGVSVRQVSDTWGAPRGEDREHEGQDIFASRGTLVFSATNGYIVRVQEDRELGGNTVWVAGAGGIRYYYAHLDRSAEGITVGQWVTTDTVIGFVGNTGNAVTTPPHLHFGVYERREALNPLTLLKDRQK